MVFVEHILWGGNCIQRQKNTGMIGVSFSKSVSKVRPRPFSWSPKVCFTATIPYINPNFRYSVHYFSSSPFKTCFHSKTKTALHQWLQNSISLMNFLLITSCSHCRINIWNIPATMLHTSYHYHWFQPTEETFTFTFLMLAYLTQAPFSFLQ